MRISVHSERLGMFFLFHPRRSGMAVRDEICSTRALRDDFFVQPERSEMIYFFPSGRG